MTLTLHREAPTWHRKSAIHSSGESASSDEKVPPPTPGHQSRARKAGFRGRDQHRLQAEPSQAVPPGFPKGTRMRLRPVTALSQGEPGVCMSRKGQGGAGTGGFPLASPSCAIPVQVRALPEISGVDRHLRGMEDRADILQEYILKWQYFICEK